MLSLVVIRKKDPHLHALVLVLSYKTVLLILYVFQLQRFVHHVDILLLLPLFQHGLFQYVLLFHALHAP